MASHLDSIVAEEVRALIARRKSSQGVVADAIGVSRQTFSARMNGGSFSVGELDAIAGHFDIPITDLFPVRPTDRYVTVSDMDKVLVGAVH